MRVILLEKQANLGDLGDTVNVKSGYGRNFLIPKGKALFATEANLEVFAKRKAEFQEKAIEDKSAAEERAKAFHDLELVIEVRASEEGKLFGSIGTVEIAHEFADKKLEIERKEIILSEGAFHNIGEYEFMVTFHSDVHEKVKLVIKVAK